MTMIQMSTGEVTRDEFEGYVFLEVSAKHGRRDYTVGLHFNPDGFRSEVRTYFGHRATQVLGKGFADFGDARAAYKAPAAVMALDLAEEAIEAYLAAEAAPAVEVEPVEVETVAEPSEWVAAAQRFCRRPRAAGARDAMRRLARRKSIDEYRSVVAHGRTFADTRNLVRAMSRAAQGERLAERLAVKVCDYWSASDDHGVYHDATCTMST